MLVPLAVILAAVVVAISVVMTSYPDTMDMYFGRGEMNIYYPDEAPPSDYYSVSLQSGESALPAAENTAKKIADEGIVLLKNDGLLPLDEGAAIAPMGYRYTEPGYSGTGSAYVHAEEGRYVDFSEGLAKYFTLNGKTIGLMNGARPYAISSSGINAVAEDYRDTRKRDSSVFEYDPSIYVSSASELGDQVGLVVIGRIGDENIAFQSEKYCDGTPHELALTSYERETIRFAKNHCKAVIVVINSSNVMEIEELTYGELECNAIVWIGAPGLKGIQSLADVLVGKVNPSGRTPDIWEADLLANPAMQNWGDFHYSNTKGMTVASNYAGDGVYFQEYEEGIYIGYRYYETASVLGSVKYGATDGCGAVVDSGAVVYPFGYGLSYTSFVQKITDMQYTENGFSVTVSVRNTGDRDGGEVVQLYYGAPYTQTDVRYRIEKSAKNLLAFKKVFLRSGESKTVKFEIAAEEMASYCSLRENPDGTQGCYFLEAGDYTLWLGKNSHESWDTAVFTQPADIWYDSQNPRESERKAQASSGRRSAQGGTAAASNKFSELTDYMYSPERTILSRSDWDGTFPDSPRDKLMAEEVKNSAFTFDPYSDKHLGNNKDSLVYSEGRKSNAPSGKLNIYDMRGMEYDDPAWDAFLAQIDMSSPEVRQMLLTHSYFTKELECVSKPKSIDVDGPQGLTYSKIVTCVYPAEVVLAATFNTDMAYACGRAVGGEALENGISGWYAPGLNLHRTAFGGRAFEYYSEDPLLSGKIGAASVSGAADMGLVAFIKHFIMANYENHSTCMSLWATEQTIRELYLKSFEIVVKEAEKQVTYYLNGELAEKTMRGCSGVMASACMLGYEWSAASYPLLTDILRGEWGFCGMVTTDMALQTCTSLRQYSRTRPGNTYLP